MSEQEISLVDLLLKPEHIKIKKDRFKKIEELVDYCLKEIYPSISKVVTMNIVQNKIKSSPSFYTVFENGLFIPHLKLEDLSEFKSLLVITPDGVKDKNTGHNVFITFMLFSPSAPSFFQKHLNILSLITRIFKDSINKIILMKTPQEIYSYLKSLE